MFAHDRHIPRICHDCGAPLAGGDDDCWKCGALWDPQATGATTPPPTQEPLSVVPADTD